MMIYALIERTIIWLLVEGHTSPKRSTPVDEPRRQRRRLSPAQAYARIGARRPPARNSSEHTALSEHMSASLLRMMADAAMLAAGD